MKYNEISLNINFMFNVENKIIILENVILEIFFHK